MTLEDLEQAVLALNVYRSDQEERIAKLKNQQEYQAGQIAALQHRIEKLEIEKLEEAQRDRDV